MLEAFFWLYVLLINSMSAYTASSRGSWQVRWALFGAYGPIVFFPLQSKLYQKKKQKNKTKQNNFTVTLYQVVKKLNATHDVFSNDTSWKSRWEPLLDCHYRICIGAFLILRTLVALLLFLVYRPRKKRYDFTIVPSSQYKRSKALRQLEKANTCDFFWDNLTYTSQTLRYRRISFPGYCEKSPRLIACNDCVPSDGKVNWSTTTTVEWGNLLSCFRAMLLSTKRRRNPLRSC